MSIRCGHPRAAPSRRQWRHKRRAAEPVEACSLVQILGRRGVVRVYLSSATHFTRSCRILSRPLSARRFAPQIIFIKPFSFNRGRCAMCRCLRYLWPFDVDARSAAPLSGGHPGPARWAAPVPQQQLDVHQRFHCLRCLSSGDGGLSCRSQTSWVTRRLTPLRSPPVSVRFAHACWATDLVNRRRVMHVAVTPPGWRIKARMT